ncbi:MAG: ABC transporter substrate-binding protein [Firmicutes bacterium]|nr:ABC transporter substrate-binding protein [Bacillota bacterium]
MRTFKKAAALIMAVVVTVGLMAGCGGDTGGEKGQNGQVYVYCFGDYFDPELEYEFEEKTGYDVIIDYFDTNEELYPVIKNNTAQYDVICASDYMIAKLIDEGLLSEINYDNVPNASNIAENVKPSFEEFDPGMKYSLPHTWGTYGIMYNKSMVNGADIDSWTDLWDEKYAEQIVMPDSMREMYMIAGKILGYSMNTTDEKEVTEMTDLLLKQKPLVYKLANDSARELMIGESAALAVITSGEVLYSQELNENIDFVIPKEGTEVWTDCWAVTANVTNKEGGEAWINFMLDGDVAEDNFEYLTYAIPNTQIADLTDNPVLNPSAEVLAKCETLKNLGAEADDMYSRYWKEYKSK